MISGRNNQSTIRGAAKYRPFILGRGLMNYYYNKPISVKNRLAALLLCFFLGLIGIHRVYVGKVGTGILYILTAGFAGIGVIVDFIMILCGSFTDKSGLFLIQW
jgi:TM2 domain-containing membrane protein YozV